MPSGLVPMRPPIIRKTLDASRGGDPHTGFSWAAARSEIVGDVGNPNIGYLATDRHLATPVADRVALRFIGRDDARCELTYRELARLSSRFANVLRGLGVGKGQSTSHSAAMGSPLDALGCSKVTTVASQGFASSGSASFSARAAERLSFQANSGRWPTSS